jgi:hypothetical protein
MTRQRAAAAAMEHVDSGVRPLRINNGRWSGGGGGGGSVGDAAAAAVLAEVLEERQLAREASATLLLLCEKPCSGKVLHSGAPGNTFFCSWEHFYAPGSALVLRSTFFLLQKLCL